MKKSGLVGNFNTTVVFDWMVYDVSMVQCILRIVKCISLWQKMGIMQLNVKGSKSSLIFGFDFLRIEKVIHVFHHLKGKIRNDLVTESPIFTLFGLIEMYKTK